MAERPRSAGCARTRAQISHYQLLCLTFTLHFTAAMIVLPGTLAKFGHSGAWLAPLVAFLLAALPVSLMLGLLVRRHPGLGLAELSGGLIGHVPGRILGLAISVFSLVIAALTLRDVVEVTPVAILPATPAWALALPFLLVAVYGAYSGVEVLARLAYFCVLGQGLIILLVFATLAGMMNPLWLLPFWERTPGQLLQAVWAPIGWFAEAWSFLPLAVLADRSSQAGRALVLGAALAAFTLMALTAVAIMVFGHQLVAQFTFPVYSLVQQIAIGEFVERLDVLMVAIWLMGMLVKASTHLWVAMSSGGYALGIKSERALLPALGLATYILMSLIPSLSWLFEFSTKAWTPLSISLGLGVPGLLLLASWVRQRRRRGEMST
ncbi:spore germination protein KB [Symbiobacterium terraclitae]|uniref:Spore germination protein KB n=1 Tax=Symbiobacterium terraclitae TaxID=557451 RepID=A0ABS4JPV2_9FIRM|nr:endospore germination permease [Symbiobacterium terraclitae]MBP2016891.1 spore germination protein KB [Symbiobacterium terraclitae]